MEKKSIKTLHQSEGASWRQRIVEYNGKKFKMYLESTSNSPCATVGNDWYHALKVMAADGTWNQVADAKSVGSTVSHYNVRNGSLTSSFNTLCEDFEKYIIAVYS